MAATMVDINRSPTCKIRVMNQFSHDVDLKQDAEIAVAERVERSLVYWRKRKAKSTARASSPRLEGSS
ncbi:hypothetical protein DPMN_012509 [Dreissena polymorpha]|uniref:Uncharacterized protein n=1 Tax=Dreissena polymorpha TaxID=45954 RepID=A0A9D4N740_DREPO|nr:hypothetical protein DPMN_012509 [Dreissena polymorpha]